MSFRFSARQQDQDHSLNPLAEAVAARKRSSLPIFDLTISNPTSCNLALPHDWTRLLDQPSVLRYDPDPQGDLRAREAIAAYYAGRGETVDPSHFFLTAGTSEAYTFLFKLLCDPGDVVLTPEPSYPLLETLASLEGLRLETYPLVIRSPDAEGNSPWHVDRRALEAAITDWTRAICIVQPNNPTGSLLAESDANYLLALAEKHDLALIVDEVFADFPHGAGRPRLLRSNGPLVFSLNGLSKLAGLPQLKLAWIHVDGNPSPAAKAKNDLEWICDAYLSVGTAPQIACPEILRRRGEFQTPIQERLRTNLATMREIMTANAGFEVLWPQGGWCIPVQCKNVQDDEAFAVKLLQTEGVLTQPGYFFGFAEENVLVLSLLVEPEIFREGVKRLASTLGAFK